MTAEFFTEGITYLKQKTERTADPSDNKTVTCLPTICKFKTSIISEKLSQHPEVKNVLAEEQKECAKHHQR